MNNNFWNSLFDHYSDHGYWWHTRPVNGSYRSDFINGGARNDHIHGNGGNDTLVGNAGRDTLEGGSGNDRLAGGAGADRIDGGWGFDSAVYSGDFGNYKVVRIGHDFIVWDLREGRPDGIDLVRNTEALKFADYTLFLDGRNNAPYGVLDLASTDADAALLIEGAQLVSNDVDFERNSLKVTAVTSVSGGGTAVLVDGNIAFDPGTDFLHLGQGETGTAVLEYTVSDGRGGVGSALVFVTVHGVGEEGVSANPDLAATDEDNAVSVDVLANDSGAGDLHLDTAAITGGLGSVSIIGNQVVYDPGAAYQHLAVGTAAGVDIAYAMSNGSGATDTSTLSVLVAGVNDSPSAAADAAATSEDEAVLVDVLANDTDVDITDVTHVAAAAITDGLGNVSVSANLVVYDPGTAYQFLGAGETATVQIAYTVADNHGASTDSTASVTVTGFNDAPVALADSATTLEDAPVSGNVLGNDSDAESDALSVLAASFDTAHGSVVISDGGGFVYTPQTNFSGNDSFDYTVSDGNGGSTVGTVNVAVEAVADAPTLQPPVAEVLYAGFESVLAPWDAIGTVATATGHALPNGGGTVLPTEGAQLARMTSQNQTDPMVSSFLGLPVGALDALNPGVTGNAFVGSAMKTSVSLSAGETFSFDWQFATTDQPPGFSNDFAFFSVDTPDPLTGTVAFELADTILVGPRGNTGWQHLTFTADTTGVYTFGVGVFNARDGSINSFLLLDDVRSTGPGANGDEDSVIPLAITAALADTDGSESLSIAIAGLGDATLNAGVDLGGGNWLLSAADLEGLALTPALDNHADLDLTVTAIATEGSNGSQATTTTSFTVVVNPVNDDPVANPDSFVFAQNTTLDVGGPGVLGNDTDVDLDLLAATLETGPEHGSLTFNADGSFSYAPEAGYLGEDAFSYIASDGAGGTAIGHVSLTIGEIVPLT